VPRDPGQSCTRACTGGGYGGVLVRGLVTHARTPGLLLGVHVQRRPCDQSRAGDRPSHCGRTGAAPERSGGRFHEWFPTAQRRHARCPRSRPAAQLLRRAGWEVAIEAEDFCAFQLRGALLALFPWDKLAADGQAEAAKPAQGIRGFSLGINVDRPEQVDETIAAVESAGAMITKPPDGSGRVEGRHAYFADPRRTIGRSSISRVMDLACRRLSERWESARRPPRSHRSARSASRSTAGSRGRKALRRPGRPTLEHTAKAARAHYPRSERTHAAGELLVRGDDP
jgi:catechol 2,3-dioxygenase-like lactoylglutathione lyase family enzyme